MTDPDQKELEARLESALSHPLLPFAWDAVRVAGDHLLGIADLKRPVNGAAGLTVVELKDD